jgi:isopropylmalate/homocitrate/citramalate synthase
MNPKNIQCLREANISYASLANNHVLDYGVRFSIHLACTSTTEPDYFLPVCVIL